MNRPCLSALSMQQRKALSKHINLMIAKSVEVDIRRSRHGVTFVKGLRKGHIKISVGFVRQSAYFINPNSLYRAPISSQRCNKTIIALVL